MYVTPVLHVSLPTKRPLPNILPLFQPPVQQSTVPTVQCSTVQCLPLQGPFLSLSSLNLNLSLASPNEEAPHQKEKKKEKQKQKRKQK